MKHAFSDFKTRRIRKFSIRILSDDTPKNSIVENVIASNENSNYGVVECAVEWREISPCDNI